MIIKKENSILTVYSSSYYVSIALLAVLIIAFSFQRFYMVANREIYRLGFK